MNYAIFQEWLMKVSLVGAAAFSAALILYFLREPLRAALERLHHARRLTQFAVLAAFAGATLFGGAKHGSETNDPTGGISGDLTSTNTPPDTTSGDTSPTNDPTMVGGVLRTPRNLTTNEISLCGDCGGPGVSALPPIQLSGEATSSSLQQEEGTHHSTPTPTLYTYLPPPTLCLITNWTRRGAYMDWHRIDFPETFSFPIGTNLLTSVTLMAYGELRQTLQGPIIANLSHLSNVSNLSHFTSLSLEPDTSSVSYGLTPSNSFVFAWENACLDREATNRVNAAIELFQNGDMYITTVSASASTSAYLPAQPPEGFIGQGQDTAWITNAFPSAAAAIAEKGYETWLMEDCIGHNTPNGLYKVAVTISALPEHGPCYLVVGPHRMVVTQPGTYSFPLEVFETYKAFTCPTRVPLSFAYDDGYDYGDDGNPPLLMAPMMAMAMTPQEELEYELRQIPPLVVNPYLIERSQGRTPIQILCNIPNAIQSYWVWGAANVEFAFLSQTRAEIVSAATGCIIEIEYRNGKGSAIGYCEICTQIIDDLLDPPGTNHVEGAGSTTNTPPPDVSSGND